VRPLPLQCGWQAPLRGGGFTRCDKPGVLVEVNLRQDSMRCFMCSDHIRLWQERGYVLRILEGDDSYVPKRLQLNEKLAKGTCKICNRLFGEHSQKEFDDHIDQIAAPTVRLFPKGQRAKKGNLWYIKCEICGRRFGNHSQQEYDACINQHMKRNKPKKEDLVYVKCEICDCRFGDHSPEKFDACIDQIIENSV
jgi:hypothetical protein